MKGLKHKRLQLIVASGLCAGLIGCSDSDTVVSTATPQATLSLAFSALDDLGADFVYEGWLLVGDTPVSTGRFSSTTDDQQMASVANAEAATKYILTIEPRVGDDPAPADTHVLAGDIIDSAATLSIFDPAALGTDFVDSTGSFILATPTQPTSGHEQGLWWLSIDVAGVAVAGLNLPVLPPGWVYEGWVADAAGPVSTGTFTDVAAADSDAGGPAAGLEPTPAFPGQDFVEPVRVITGMAAVISVEPSPDNSPAPFGIKPLIDATIENVGASGPQDMENVIGTNQPSGTLTIAMP